MTRLLALCAVVTGVVAGASAAQPAGVVAEDGLAPRPAGETIAEIRVQGNFTVASDVVVAASGLALGDPVPVDLVDAVRGRLEATGRFESVEVRKRYRSLTATDQVAVILVVRERPGASASTPVGRSLAGLARRTMFLPILRHDEGYGMSYGARSTLVELFGTDGRLSVPATWGGERRIALEADLPLAGSLVDRLRAGVSRGRRRHPTFELDDDRTRAWLGAERRLGSRLRLTAALGREAVTFGRASDRLTRYAVGLDYGATGSSMFPRDHLSLSAGVEWVDLGGGAGAITRPRFDARLFKGVGGQVVLMVRGRFDGASAALPVYEQSLLGGGGSVRGWSVGADVGDRLALATVELRMPMTSPLAAGTAGVRVFYDTGTVYDVGHSLDRQRFRQGVGAGLFMQVPLLQLSLDVGHNLRGSARLHVGAAVSF